MYEKGLVDGLYFALPTRSAAVQIHKRVERLRRQLSSLNDAPPVVRAVPGYEPEARTRRVLPCSTTSLGGKTVTKTTGSWASRNPKRYLAAQIAVGTVDQAMMGALQVRNAHMRAACLARNLLVVDEVHASDAYMSVVLEALLDAHVGAGGYALLMSATLGSAARHGWLHHGKRAGDGPTLDKAIDVAYPAVSTSNRCGRRWRKRSEKDSLRRDESDHARLRRHGQDALWTAARVGAKVLVVRNTVGHAVSTQQALEEVRRETGDAGLLFDVERVSEPSITGVSPPVTAQYSTSE